MLAAVDLPQFPSAISGAIVKRVFNRRDSLSGEREDPLSLADRMVYFNGKSKHSGYFCGQYVKISTIAAAIEFLQFSST